MKHYDCVNTSYCKKTILLDQTGFIVWNWLGRINALIIIMIITLGTLGGFTSTNVESDIDTVLLEKISIEQLLHESGFRGGLIVHVGSYKGELNAALIENDAFVLEGLESDLQKLELYRKNIRDFDLDGRITFKQWTSDYLPYTDNLVNVLLWRQSAGEFNLSEIMRILGPRGVAYIQDKKGWRKMVKPWPDEIDEWNHYLHGPDGNAVARDTRIGPPQHIQWSAGPLWGNHHNRAPSVSSMVSAKGRIFYIHNEEPPGYGGNDNIFPSQWYLYCRDAFNGILLWKRPMEDWGWQAWADSPVTSDGGGGRFLQPQQVSQTLIAFQDRLFVTLGFNSPVSMLDASTGEVLKTFEATLGTDELIYENGVLIAAVYSQSLTDRKEAALQSRRSDIFLRPGKRLIAIDVETGKVLWQSPEFPGINAMRGFLAVYPHLNPVIGGGRVFAVTRDSLVGLDIETGKILWKTPRPIPKEHETRYDMNAGDMVTLVYHDNILLFAQLEPEKRLGWEEEPGSLNAFSAENGEWLWSLPVTSWGWASEPDIFVVNDIVWVWGLDNSTPMLGLDPLTGEVVKEMPGFQTFDINHHSRCYRNKATSRFMITSWRGSEFLPFSTDDKAAYNLWWFRAACRHGFLPANGMIYNSPDPCVCYLNAKLMHGFNALVSSSSEQNRQTEISDKARLVKGPAYQIMESSLPVNDFGSWPTFRYDNYRSGITTVAVPVKLDISWRTELNGIPASAVIAEEKVFIPLTDRNTIVALDAVNGNKLWLYTTNGRIDTPPTYNEGYLFFGCADGYVYKLRASDGELAWRFLAAPQVLRIMVDGRLESAWPVHGSIIIENQRAYVVAGRSSFLDGGLRTWVIDTKTGNILDKAVITDADLHPKEAEVEAYSGPGVNTDVPVSDGRSIYVKRQIVFRDVLNARDRRQLLSPLSSFVDNTWFNRASQWKLGSTLHGEYLIADKDSAFSFKAYSEIDRSADHSFLRPGTGNYQLYSVKINQEELSEPGDSNTRKRSLQISRWVKEVSEVGDKNTLWKKNIEIGVTAMIKAGSQIYLAGPPDIVPENDPWKNIEKRGEALLLVVSAKTGDTISKLELPASTVLDGLSAAYGRLYVVTVNGNVLCFDDK